METTYQKALRKLREEHRIHLGRLRSHKDLIKIAEEYAGKFSPNHEMNNNSRYSTASWDSFIWLGAKLDLYLGKEDKADYANPIIEEMIRDPRLDMVETPPEELENTQAAEWQFVRKGNEKWSDTLYVRVHFDQSESCKLVGTGRFTEPREIMKMVCS